MTNTKSYIASFNIENGIYGITFYDFPGCVSVGDDIEEAIYNANEALELHTECMIKDGEQLPEPTDLKDIIADEGASDMHVLVKVNISNVKLKAIDVSLAENIITQIDAITNNRDKFLEEASLYYIDNVLKKS